MKKLYEIMLINFSKEKLKQKALFALKGIEKIRFISICLVLLMSLAFQNVSAQFIPVENLYCETTHMEIDDYGNVSMNMIAGDIGMIWVYSEPWNATIKEITVESSNPEIVNFSIDWYSELYRVKVFTYSTGEAVITIHSMDPSYTEALTVGVNIRSIEQGEMTIDPEVLTLEATDYGWVSAYVAPDPYDPDYKIYLSNVAWSISDDMVATIDENGDVLAITPGEAIITGTFNNNITASCDLTVVRKPPAKPKTPKSVLVSGKVESGNLNDGILKIGSIVKFECDSEDAIIRYTLDGSDPRNSTDNYPASGTNTIKVNQEMTIRAVSFRDDSYNVTFSNEVVFIYGPPKLEKPWASPSSPGTYPTPIYGSSITLNTTGLDGGEIRYTLDDTEPHNNSPLYTTPIKLNETTMLHTYINPYNKPQYQAKIKAKTFKDGFTESNTQTFTYIAKADKTILNPDLTLSCATPGVKIYYTTGILPPDENSALYTGPLNYPEVGEVNYKAAAFKNGYWHGDYIEFTLSPILQKPYVKKNGVKFESPATFSVLQYHTVHLESKFNGQRVYKIRYTTDGSEPNENSLSCPYDTGIGINPPITIKAKAYLDGHPETETSVFTFTLATPPATPTVNIPSGTTVNYDRELYPTAAGATGFIYTTDGNTPWVNFDLWNNVGTYIEPGKPIKIKGESPIKIIAIKPSSDPRYYTSSPVATFTYKVNPVQDSFNMDNFNTTIPSSIPILSGKLMNIVLNNIHCSMYVSNTVVKIAIGDNFAVGANSEQRNAKFITLKNKMNASDRAGVKTVITPITKSSTIAGSSSTFEVVGYLEGNLDNSGNIKSLTGKIMLYADVDSGYEMWLSILNVRIGVYGNIPYWGGTTLNFYNNPKFAEPQSILEYKIGVSLSAGIGIKYIAGVGVKGSIDFNHKWDMVHKYNKMWIYGKVEVYERFLFWKKYQTITSGTKIIMNSFPSVYGAPYLASDDPFKLNLFDFSKYELMPRVTSSKWMGESPARLQGAAKISVLQHYVYSETAPLIAEAGGNRIMVFLADESSRDDFNRTVLMYSVYNSSNNTWGAPQAVDDNGTADFFPSIASDGSRIWLTWHRSNTTFGSDVEIEDVLAAGEIAVTSFNNSLETFYTPTILTNNNFMDTQPKVAVSDSNPINSYIVWIQNPENDIFGANGANRIVLGWIHQEGGCDFSIIKDNLGMILELEVDNFGGQCQIAYITDNDNDFETIEDRNLIVIDENGAVLHTPVTNKLVSGINFTTINGNKALVWNEEGRLRYMTENGQIHNLTAEQDMLTDNYKVLSNGTKTSVVFPYLEDEIGYFCVRNYEDGQLGNQFKIARTDGFARFFDGVLESNGEFNLVYNNSVMWFDDDDELQEENDLVWMKVAPQVNIRLKDVFYLIEDVTLGQPLTVTMDIENIGGFAVNDIAVKVNGSIAGTYPVELKPGENTTLDFALNVPSSMAPQTKFVLTVEPVGLTDVNMNDNSYSLVLGYTNFSLSLEPEYSVFERYEPDYGEDEPEFVGGDSEYVISYMLTVTTKVTNSSDFAANAMLLVRLGSEDGTVIKMVELGDIDGRESVISEMIFDIATIVTGNEYFVRLYFEVVTDANSEYKTFDYIVVYRDENIKMLSGIAYEIVDEEIVPIEGVTATCWVADDENGTNARIWEGDEEDYEFVNPQITGEGGYYKWFTAEGWWQVRLTKEGYEDTQSEWMYILPQRPAVVLEMINLSNIKPNKYEDNNSSIVVHPNPTKGKLKIESGELRIENVEIFDITGRFVQTSTPSERSGEVDISSLSSGIYFLRIKTDNGVFTEKVVKN